MRNHQRIAAGLGVLATLAFPIEGMGQNLLDISPELVQASSTAVGVTGYPQTITITNESGESGHD